MAAKLSSRTTKTCKTLFFLFSALTVSSDSQEHEAKDVHSRTASARRNEPSGSNGRPVLRRRQIFRANDGCSPRTQSTLSEYGSNAESSVPRSPPDSRENRGVFLSWKPKLSWEFAARNAAKLCRLPRPPDDGPFRDADSPRRQKWSWVQHPSNASPFKRRYSFLAFPFESLLWLVFGFRCRWPGRKQPLLSGVLSLIHRQRRLNYSGGSSFLPSRII